MWIDNGYLHEVRFYPDQNSEGFLPSCVSFGPAGDEARKLTEELEKNSGECVWIFYANSHQDAMILYYEFVGYGIYLSSEVSDQERYPDSWYQEQKEYLINLLQTNV